ncbi:sugar-binding transcriptional regulator [Propionicicella superfundia]|uniref:sugar-binding transcriptional regulator n=1 Tax=Propionicicella superfundia TaxID=348582 RepID=UPI0003FA1166|nr:sugar-binding domain-containing protein [Propionicicella superfundia]
MFVTPARVCYLYYERGLTQQQIAAAMGVNRVRVSRMLRQARDDGTVTIGIRYRGFFPEMESALRVLHRGVEFIICDPLDGSFTESKHAIAATAADYLDGALHPTEKVAIGCGRTLRETADLLSATLPGAEFIPLIGGQEDLGLEVHANTIAERMAELTGGRARRIFCPALAKSPEERDLLTRTPSISGTLDEAAKAQTCLYSVEDPTRSDSSLSLAGYHTEHDVATLREAGAACDIQSIVFLNAAGERCGTSVSDRTLSITEDQFRAIPRKICLAGGTAKKAAVSIALAAGFIDVLITDAETALHLLGDEGRADERGARWTEQGPRVHAIAADPVQTQASG